MFTFPEIKTTRTSDEQAFKVYQEWHEFSEAKTPDEKDQEALDVWHAAETFIRVHFKGREQLLARLIDQTIEKNTQKGYYTKKCF